MTQRREERLARLAATVEAAAVFLFFLQSLRVLFSVLFGVIYDALFAETVPMSTVGLILLAVLVALMAPLALPRRGGAQRAWSVAAALVTFAARVPMTLNEPRLRLAATILIVAGATVYLATRLRSAAPGLARAIVLALLLDLMLRLGGQTFDVTLQPAWWPGQLALSLGLSLLSGWLVRLRRAEEPTVGASLGVAGAFFWGGWLFLQSSLLDFPNALARWSGESYLVFALFWPFVLVLGLLANDLLRQRRGRAEAIIFLVLLECGLAVGYLSNGVPASLGLLVAQLAALTCLFSSVSPHSDRPAHGVEAGLALGGFLYLLLGFAYAFAFTYAYTLDLFRGTGLGVFLVAGLIAALPTLRRPTPAEREQALRRPAWPTIWGVGALVVALAFGLTASPERSALKLKDTFRAATYNIHYGYDSVWHLSLEQQAQAIEAAGVDVVAFQEVDTGRPTSYMLDDALWLADRLGMEAVYMPCVEKLTGIALLSRYPVIESDTLLLPSELEQTGIIWARLDVAGTTLNAFAIWLGLEPEERARQLDAALPFLAAHPGPAVFGGDFNSTDDSPVYARIAAAGFVDPFAVLGLGSPPTDPAIRPTKRIDFVWLRELEPRSALVSDGTASDHRMVVVEVAAP